MLRIHLRLAVCLLLASCLSSASFINGDFEIGNLSSWSAVGNVTASTGQDYPGLAIVSPDSGDFAARLISESVPGDQIAAQMSIDQNTLNASNGGAAAAAGALIWQSVFANAGDILHFRWNFVERDYEPFDDWAFYGLQYGSDAATLTRLASVGTQGPDDNGSISGWTSSAIVISQTGTYTLYFGVVNGEDGVSPADLWIDGVVLQDNSSGPGSEVPEPATFTLLLPVIAGLALRYRRGKGDKA